MNEYISSDPEFQNILDRFPPDVEAAIYCGYGWAEIIKECDDALFREDPNYAVVQIKEKFGGLRFYFNPSDMTKYVQLCRIIAGIEEKAFSICEQCGADGYKRRTNAGKIYTSCDDHALED